MNRKNKEKENINKDDQDFSLKTGEPIPPKFVSNWLQNIRFDRVVINLAGFVISNLDCEYDVLTRVAKELKFKIKNDAESPEWDIWWTDWHVQSDTLLKMEHHQKINHFPGMFNLSRKNLLAKNLMRMRKKASDDYNFFPLTWNIPSDYNELKAYHETKPKGKSRTYIVKPESMSQGKGIFLTKKLEDIPLDQRCVVQRYLSKPYLIDGLKFDLRIYVLVGGVDPLKLFIYHQGLARFATEPYVAPNKENIDDICMHLTNYAINKESDKFVFNNDEKNMSTGHKRSLTSIYELLEQKGVNVGALKSKINQMIVKTMISGLSHLRFQYRSCQLDNYRSDMCFEILGFDVILSEDLEPYILEINYTPSFSTDTPLDESIKKNLIKDTLILMELTKSFKEKTVNERKEFRNARMLTGKTNKMSVEERKEKIKIAQEERDAYIDQNMGAFTKIYPLNSDDAESKELMEKYNYLISIEDEIVDKRKEKEAERDEKERAKKEKVEKLPLLTVKDDSKRKSQASCKLIESKHKKEGSDIKELSMTGKREESIHIEKRSETAQGAAEKILRKRILVREPIANKKKLIPRRETLNLKSIQFEGGRFDGLCENFKNNILFQNRLE